MNKKENIFYFKMNTVIYKYMFIILIGTIIRLLFIQKQSLWLDEMTTIQVSLAPIDKILSGKAFDNHTPPLYYALMWLWFKITPISEMTVRIPSVMFDLLNMVLIINISKNFLDKRNTGLVLLAYAFSPFMIYYSQEGRMYTLFVFFTMLFIYSIIKISSCQNNYFIWAILSGLIFSFGLYTHYYMVFFSIPVYLISIYVFRQHKNKLLAIIVSGLIGAIFFLPWVPIVIKLATSGGQQFRKFSFTIIPYTIFRFVIGYAVFPINMLTKENVYHEVIKHSAEIIGVFGTCILLFYNLVKSIDEKNKKYLVLLGWIICLPVLLSLMVSFKVPMISERYLVVLLPFIYMVFLGFNKVEKNISKIAVVAFFILQITGIAFYFFNPQFGKAQWRDAGKFVKNVSIKEDIIIVEPSYAINVFKYYFKGSQIVYPVSRYFDNNDNEFNHLFNLLQHKKRVILISSGTKKVNFSKKLEKMSSKVFFHVFPLETGITCSIWQSY